jgi:ABC-type molybdate transport system substrate-binding protein
VAGPLVLAVIAPPVAAQDIAVFAAGSLRAPLTDLAAAFERSSGRRVVLTFGASGLLRDRIDGGEPADVFASANMQHPQALVARGWASATVRFARNRMCLLTSPNVRATPATALATMLDAKVRLGTSTPKADPSGDYAWEVFRKAEALRPGAYAALTAKALQLTGGPQSPPPPPRRGSVYTLLVASGAADAFLTYCTNAEIAHAEDARLRVVRLPDALAVGADYGAAVRSGAPAEAAAFLAFVASPEGTARLRAYGFDPP